MNFQQKSVSIFFLLCTVLAGCGGEFADDMSDGPTSETSQAATATLADWNSCYIPHGDVAGTLGETFCFEQWGSFPSACSSVQDDPGGALGVNYVSGKRCQGIGQIKHSDGSYTCQYGDYENYNSFYSWYFVASAYSCNETPSVSNVSIALGSNLVATGSYTFSQQKDGPDSSRTMWYRVSGSTQTQLATDTPTTTISSSWIGDTLRYCVIPRTQLNNDDGSGDTNYASNSWYTKGNETCTTMTIPGTPSASNVTATISGATATGSYTFSDSGDGSESGSTYIWQRSNSASGSNATMVGTSQTYSLVDSDNNNYLRFCVTPANALASGTKVCSNWTSVGRLVVLYKDSYLSGTSIALAYQLAGSGTCLNLTNYGFNDMLSSYKIYTPAASSASISLYQHINCSGTVNTWSNIAANVGGISNTVSQNDEITSIKVTF